MDAQIELATENFHNTALEFLKITNEAAGKNFNRQPSPGSWSLGQVADHTNKSISGIVKTLRAEGNVAERDPMALEPMLRTVFLNFETAYQRPDSLQPRDFVEKQSLVDHIKANIEKLLSLVKTEDLRVIPTGIAIPGIGEMTKLEWLYMADYHTRRHIHQMQKTRKAITDMPAEQ